MVGSRFNAAGALVSLVLPFVSACGGATRTGPEEGTGGSANTGGAAVSKNTGGSPISKNSGGSTATNTGGTPNDYRSAKDYDQGCAIAANCALVTEGPRCGCSTCPNAAINVGDVPLWDAAGGTCPPTPCPEIICESAVVACRDGMCTVRPPHYIDASAFDRSCSTDAECVLVPTGEYCSSCSCERAAVSVKGYEKYLAQIAEFETCDPEPSACRCAVPTAALCVPQPGGDSGRCEARF